MQSRHGNSLSLGALARTGCSLILPPQLRDKHLYVAGATGTGKSKFLEHLIRQDILANRASGCGVLVVDPHGSLYDNLVAWMTRTNLHRPVILIDMRDADWVVGYNILRQRENANPSVIVENFVQAMAHVWGQAGTDETPLFARWAGNTLRALYDQGYTLSDAAHLLGNRPDIRAAMTSGMSEPMARGDWDRANAMKPDVFDDKIGSTVNRIRRFLGNDVLRCMFGQPSASLDLGSAIEEGAVVLVSLAREGGRVSKEDSELFATLLLTDLWTAAQERGKRKGAKPFYVYLDEFQRFVTPTIAENLDEARGFGLHLTLAHQFPKQLLDAGPHGRRVYNSVIENASSKIVFRLTDWENMEPLAKWLFMGVMNPDEVKHELYSTKVMAYREEERITISRSTMSASAYAEHGSTSEGTGQAGGETFDVDGVELGSSLSASGYSASTAGRTYSSQDAVTESESRGSVLIPVMGKELSHVQFRSLEEQVYRAAASLFAQGERQFTARLVGMRAPVSLMTPFVDDPLVQRWRVKEWVEKQMARSAFMLPAAEAMQRLREREIEFAKRFAAVPEPTETRRRVR